MFLIQEKSKKRNITYYVIAWQNYENYEMYRFMTLHIYLFSFKLEAKNKLFK